MTALSKITSPRTDEERWTALAARDATADGTFLYGVSTTGVFCRPHCASRLPRRENVRFFSDAASAVKAGFRACKRCHPDRDAPSPDAEAIARACRLIETAEDVPSLDHLAQAVGLSRFHFHRTFRRVTGLTPRAYGAARRSERARVALRESDSVTGALYESGFQSSGRFYEAAPGMLGMTPSAFRAGGVGERITFAAAPCALGWIQVAATARGICAIQLGDTPEALEAELRAWFGKASLTRDETALAECLRQAIALLDEPQGSVALPLDIRGTALQQRVWQILTEIPPGQTVSYTELARRAGHPAAVRAVAQACARNRIALAIPCHRAVRNDGGLAGYRWGLARKKALLEREGEE
jgi:AraC family transcriptional regulator of adaptative response/methylated-DNA-[protein]-cysteine methyltransferase